VMMLWNFLAIATTILKPKRVSLCSLGEIRAAICLIYLKIWSLQNALKLTRSSFTCNLLSING
jgi:hypothetical protein